MARQETDKAMDRRNFLRGAGGASTAAVATALAGPLTAGPAQAMDPGGDETRARYRETEHVKAYYRTNRY